MSKKLVIQIPCYNEEFIIAETLAAIPKLVDGFDEVILIVIDDGSEDNTASVALGSGANYVIRHRSNRGLSRAFITGIRFALKLGADVIVNTDADHQYPGDYIPKLVNPILLGQADLVIGNRQPLKNQHFSPIKRYLEAAGSWFIRKISDTDAPDAPSGFRAFSRYAAMNIQVFNDYSYTLETLIQAGKERLKICHVPIFTNASKRPSRLHKGILNFMWRQGEVILRSYILYNPLKTFVLLGSPFMFLGLFFLLRFIYFFLIGDSGVGRYIQSVSIGGTLFTFGFLLIAIGLLADALQSNRKIMQEILMNIRSNSIFSSEEQIKGYVFLASSTVSKSNDNQLHNFDN